MSRIKAILMDLDGTLVNSERKISPLTKNVLMKAQNMGIRLILASGRPISGMTSLAKELEMEKHHGMLICFNGSKVIDCETNEVLYNRTLTILEGKQVLEHMKKFNVKPMICKDNYMFVNNVFDGIINFNGDFNVIEYEARGGNFLLCEIDDLSLFMNFPLNKILTAGDPDYMKLHYKEMMEPFKDSLSCMFTSPFYFEFTAKGIDKGNAIKSILHKINITSDEMIAFGDAQNDKTMLEYCGIGVAMGNAVEELKEIADEITLSNNEDGIAYSLMKHIPELKKVED